MDAFLITYYSIMSDTQSQFSVDSFNPKKAELIALADESKKVLSVEIVDSKTYEQVHQAQMKLKEARVNIEKT